MIIKTRIMTTPQHLSAHFKGVYFGPNWTLSNLKDTLSDVNYLEATQQVDDFNTIAKLVYHIHYFVRVAIPVLKGEELKGDDKESFDVPEITSEKQWQDMLSTYYSEAQEMIDLIESLPEEKMNEAFWDARYKTYFYNLNGTIEHTHYHLGQIAILKKLIKAK